MSGESIMTESSHDLPLESTKTKSLRRAKRHLDEALEETFPASDAPAMLEPAPNLAQAEQKEESASQPRERKGDQ